MNVEGGEESKKATLENNNFHKQQMWWVDINLWEVRFENTSSSILIKLK